MRISRGRQKRNHKSIEKEKSEAKSIDNLQFESAILATNDNVLTCKKSTQKIDNNPYLKKYNQRSKTIRTSLFARKGKSINNDNDIPDANIDLSQVVNGKQNRKFENKSREKSDESKSYLNFQSNL